MSNTTRHSSSIERFIAPSAIIIDKAFIDETIYNMKMKSYTAKTILAGAYEANVPDPSELRASVPITNLPSYEKTNHMGALGVKNEAEAMAVTIDMSGNNMKDDSVATAKPQEIKTAPSFSLDISKTAETEISHNIKGPEDLGRIQIELGEKAILEIARLHDEEILELPEISNGNPLFAQAA